MNTLDLALETPLAAIYTYREFYIPDRMMCALLNYINHGHPIGDFLNAVLCNDLSEACGRADAENPRNLPAYTVFLYNEAPSTCYGSKEKVAAWLERFQVAS